MSASGGGGDPGRDGDPVSARRLPPASAVSASLGGSTLWAAVADTGGVETHSRDGGDVSLLRQTSQPPDADGVASIGCPVPPVTDLSNLSIIGVERDTRQTSEMDQGSSMRLCLQHVPNPAQEVGCVGRRLGWRMNDKFEAHGVRPESGGWAWAHCRLGADQESDHTVRVGVPSCEHGLRLVLSRRPAANREDDLVRAHDTIVHMAPPGRHPGSRCAVRLAAL